MKRILIIAAVALAAFAVPANAQAATCVTAPNGKVFCLTPVQPIPSGTIVVPVLK
jgi:hypothetical protein